MIRRMGGAYAGVDFVLPTSTPAAADLLVANATLPMSAPPANGKGKVVTMKGAEVYTGYSRMHGDSSLDTSSVSGFMSSITGWASANPLLAGGLVLGGVFLLRGRGRR